MRLFLMMTMSVCLVNALGPDSPRRTLSTWIGVGTRTTGPHQSTGGMGGRDVTEALAWVTAHKEHISSLSITGYGKPGAKNISATAFNKALASMGIDTYQLIGGNFDNFKTPEAINRTVTAYLRGVEEG